MGNRMRQWVDAHAGKTYMNYIGGEWVAAGSGKTYALYESALPSHQLGEFPDSDAEDVERAVRAAESAFRTWRRTPGSERAALLHRFANALERHEEELSYLISAEQGKVLTESVGEVRRAVVEARFAAGEALRVEGSTLPSENRSIRADVVRYPIGVVGAISPWNFPLVTPVRKVAPALAYGCTVVLKPASATPWTAVRAMELLAEAGAPPGVANLVIGSGSQVGEPLVAHPSVSGISFTGSTALGMRMNGVAASRLARTQLELGGKNAALVLDYEELDDAASQIVSSAFGCSGQRCTAISRVIVLRGQATALIERLIERIGRIQVGPAWSEGAAMGPLLDRKHYETVTRYLETGQQEGAILACGGERMSVEGSDGYYLSPALFVGATADMRIAREEIFGPVLTVIEAEDVDEAAAIANATEYGLAASVFTDRLDVAQAMAEQLECGMVHVNHGTASQAHVPFGGMKKSGFGPFSIGRSNQEFFTGTKAVYVKTRDSADRR